jgi:hypothetical protein
MKKKMEREAMVVEEAGVVTPTMSGGERSEPERRGGVLIPQINGLGFPDYLEHSVKFSQYTNQPIFEEAA